MTSLALYVPSGSFGAVHNPFGKDTANLGLFRALARHGGFDDLGILGNGRPDPVAAATALFGDTPGAIRFWTESVLRTSVASRAGTVLRGVPDLAALAWQRQAVGDRSHSLVGLIHTLAPPAVRDQIAASVTAPLQPWDALICTSPAVEAAARDMLESSADYLAFRFGGQARPMPRLPLIPLGVDADAMAAKADRPAARARTRAAFRVRDDEALILWLGRLSHDEKAFPQPMFRAVEEARSMAGVPVHFVLAGWFPDAAAGPKLYAEAARAYAPNVSVHFVDGNDRALIDDLWAASDVFLSLVDNIQETFGLTPLEAMAAGLPVVASDWNGYRYTMRNEEEGFLIPTLGGPPGAGRLMLARHVLGFDSYQTYAGTVANHTAVDVGRAAAALAALIGDPTLRRRMGAAGRERVRSTFDWPVVARQVRVLVDELAGLRAEAPRFGEREGPPNNPVKRDPFSDFAGFATAVLGPRTRIALRPDVDPATALAEVARTEHIGLDRHSATWRADQEEIVALLGNLTGGVSRPVAELLAVTSPDRRDAHSLAVMWLCKLGILTWTT